MSTGPEVTTGVWRRVALGGRVARLLSHARTAWAAARGPAILSMVHAGSGGLVLTNADLMSALSERRPCFILATGPRKWTLSLAHRGGSDRIAEIVFAEDWGGEAPPSPDRLAAFTDALTNWRISLVHMRSMLGSGPEFLSAAKQAGRAVVLSFHDFLAVCPNIQLLDAEFRHCAGICTAAPADCSAPSKWRFGAGRLKGEGVFTWRARVAQALGAADTCVTTAPSAAALLSAHFPELTCERLRIIEHGRADIRSHAAQPPGAQPRIVALNIIESAKGEALLRELIARNAANGTPFAFHLLGPGRIEAAPGCVTHGAYKRDDLPALLAGIGPSFSLTPSLWPETFSHTLTESWLAGVPVLASNLGAPADRIRKNGGGWLLDPRDPDAWFDTLARVSADPDEWASKAGDVKKMRFRTLAEMAADYESLYAQLLR